MDSRWSFLSEFQRLTRDADAQNSCCSDCAVASIFQSVTEYLFTGNIKVKNKSIMDPLKTANDYLGRGWMLFIGHYALFAYEWFPKSIMCSRARSNSSNNETLSNYFWCISSSANQRANGRAHAQQIFINHSHSVRRSIFVFFCFFFFL